MNARKMILALCLLIELSLPRWALAQGTAFTFQGRLTDGGAPANGSYDLQFVLRDSGTNQVGPTLVAAPVPVAAGQFTVTLDFGMGAFNGAPRWLEIGVRANGSATAYTTLAPRQALTATPYAVHALVASNVVGNISDTQLSPNIPRLSSPANFIGQVSFSPLIGAPFRVNNATLVTNLNADLLDGLDSSAFAATGHVHAAGDLTSGTLADARLSANVALLNRLQTFTASNTFTGVLTATNGSNNFGGRFTGDGGALTNLNASNLAGLISDSRLSTNVARLGSNQTFTGVVTFNPPSGGPFAAGNTNRVTNLNADLLDGLNSSAFWNLNGNSGATNANFIGTLDNQPLEFRVNNARILRLIPTLTSPNILAGSPANSVASNVAGATVSGGGLGNTAGANYATVAGGSANTAAGTVATVSGGLNNAATNFAATVPGGGGNVAGGQYSFAAGQNARATHDGTLVWADSSSVGAFTSAAPNTVVFRAVGGVGIGTNAPQAALHVAGTVQADGLKLPAGASAGSVLTSDTTGNGAWIPPAFRVGTNATSPNLIGGHAGNFVAAGVVGTTIGGGGAANATNQITANYGTVAGGRANRVTGVSGFVGGGENNAASNTFATVSGGLGNVAQGNSSTVSGGNSNLASGTYSSVGGGNGNKATAADAAVSGGATNLASGLGAAIGGGLQNTASGLRSVVSGGANNSASGSYGTVAGGFLNTATGFGSTVMGGVSNEATNSYGTVLGGFDNVAGGFSSYAAGNTARALHDGAFVWADVSSALAFSSTVPNQFLIRAAGGVGINTSNPSGAALSVNGPATFNGNLRLNNSDLLLRGDPDPNHGLGWYGSDAVFPNKLFAGQGLDGPVLYGYSAGGLGTTAGGPGGGQNLALTWNRDGNVILDPLNRNNGALGPGLLFGEGGSGEGIASKRTVGGNRYGLDFYTGYVPRLSIANGGNVGIGTSNPGERLDLLGPDATMRIHNSNDGALGGFVENTFASLQLGLFSESGNAGQVLSGTKRSFFGLNYLGMVGSLVNLAGSPQFRNLLDDGNGNCGIGVTSVSDSRLQVNGNVRINDNDLFLRGGADRNHGLGWYGFGKLYAGINFDGPVLYGWTAGALATKNAGDRIALTWNNGGDVGIGTTGPGARLHVAGTAQKVGIVESSNAGGTWFGLGNTSSGGREWSVISSGVGNGEGPGRLLFFTSQDNSTKFRLEPNGDLWIAGTLSQGSDRNRKENLKQVNPREVLDRVAGLQIQNWNYKDDEYKAPHIGPMAQDFHATFGVGKDDKSIASVDADGVALAAIQGLNEVVKEKEAKIASLEKRLTQLEHLVKALAKRE